MRRWICTLLSILMLICAAQAETYFGTQKDDLYYHINMRCGGANGMIPITTEDADADGKYPCPICIQDDTEWESDASAVARGNTIVVRISDSWIERHELYGDFHYSFFGFQQKEESPETLSEYLHGDAFNRVLREIQSGETNAVLRAPTVLRTDENRQSVLVMNRRHIGNAWYITFRPEAQIGDHWDMRWRINAFEIDVQSQGHFTFDLVQQSPVASYPLATPQFSESAAFSAEYDGCQIDVFADAGQDVRANVAVITVPNADKDNLTNCALRIGDQVSIPINGYMDSESAIFCCTLTDAEVAHLENGAKAQVKTPSAFERAAYFNDEYRAVRDETDLVGIMNSDGSYVIRPMYDTISQYRMLNSLFEYPATIAIPFFCFRDEEGLTILDGETLDTIAQYAPVNGAINAYYLNPSAFEMRDNRGTRIMSLRTGDLLFKIPQAASESSADAIQSVDGWYRCMADGYPERLIAEYADGDRLIDLTGNPASEVYPRITPLIWKDGRGIFLVDTWDPSETDQFFVGLQIRRGEALSFLNSEGRCGLMDENGKIIAPIEYTSIEVTKDLNILLGGADGSIVVPF